MGNPMNSYRPPASVYHPSALQVPYQGQYYVAAAAPAQYQQAAPQRPPYQLARPNHWSQISGQNQYRPPYNQRTIQIDPIPIPAGFANKDQVAAIEDFSDDEEIPCMVHCRSPNARLNNWTAVEIPKIFSFSKSLNKPIEHDTATVSYNLELPINQADEDGESNDELPEEMARLLEQESKEIQPNQEPVEAINLGTEDDRQTGDDHFIAFIVSPAADWRRSFYSIYRFTSVRLATIILQHLSFHQRQTGDDHLIVFIVSPASDWRRSFPSFIVSPASDWRRSFYHLSFHQRQTGNDHVTLPSESTFSTGD
ncbi:hypothetical protein P8452_31790 [Trifolium repens]|nr:hypothetical protein P8452_31790 [Trifolium repens]